MRPDVAFSISQFQRVWRIFCRACPDRRMVADDGLDMVFSGLPIAFFNVVIVTGDDVSRPQLEASCRRAGDWAAATGLPWLFVVTHEALSPGTDATEILDGCNLTPVLPLTGMRTEDVTPPAGVVTGLDLSCARDRPACEAVFDINAAAYAATLDACKPIFGEPSFWHDHVLSLGRIDGRFVASTAVLMVDGYRYVAMVATLPDFQRRGYAEAVMRHALDNASARFGSQPTVLHATQAGRPIYERMGYKTLASHTAYMEKRFLEDH
jgi:GNAT superfamily N-acetyltransferase